MEIVAFLVDKRGRTIKHVRFPEHNYPLEWHKASFPKPTILPQPLTLDAPFSERIFRLTDNAGAFLIYTEQ